MINLEIALYLQYYKHLLSIINNLIINNYIENIFLFQGTFARHDRFKKVIKNTFKGFNLLEILWKRNI